MLLALALVIQEAEGLIRALGDEDVEVRDRATARLVEMGPQGAAPILERAAAHRDPEVRARARAVREAFRPTPVVRHANPIAVRAPALPPGSVWAESSWDDGTIAIHWCMSKSGGPKKHTSSKWTTDVDPKINP